MKRKLAFMMMLAALALGTTAPKAASTGVLQITGEAGVQVFLDGNLKGATNAEQLGLIIPNVPAGAHILKAVKPGAPAKSLNLSLKPGEVKVLPLGPFDSPAAAPTSPTPTPAAPPDPRTSLAVYPIKAAGAGPELATAMSALLAAKLTPSTKLRVIEEAMLKTVMDRQGLNASDACDDTSCQVDIGKLVKAQKLVTGDLSKFGPKYILSLKVVDISTGVNEFNAEVKSTCTEDKLDQLVEVAAAKIRNNFGEGIPVPPLPDEAPPPSAAPASALGNAAPLPQATAASGFDRRHHAPSPSPYVSSPGKISVGIYPIKPVGADPTMAGAMTALLGTMLTPSPNLRVIEAAMIKAVTERQGQNASDTCDDTSCLVEVGKLFKAQKMISGNLTKFGSKYILSLKVVDIQNGFVEFSTEDKCICSEDQLDQLVAAAAAKVRNHFGESLPVPSLP